MKEIEIQNIIIDHLESLGYAVLRINGVSRGKIQSYRLRLASRGFTKGFPDIMCLKDDKTLLFEIKTPTGKLSDVQAELHRELKNKCNVNVYTVNSLDQVKEILEVIK